MAASTPGVILLVLAAFVGPYYLPAAAAAAVEGRRRRRQGRDTASPPPSFLATAATTLADRDAPLTIAFRACCAVFSTAVAWAALRHAVTCRLADVGGPAGLGARLALARAATAAGGGPRPVLAWVAAHAPALMLASSLPRALITALSPRPAVAAALSDAAAAAADARLARLGLAPRAPRALAAALAGLGAPAGGAAWAAVVGGGLTALALALPLVARLQQHRARTGKGEAGHPASAWTAARDLAVAPLAEEAAFRGGLLPLLLLAGWSGPAAVLVSSAAFGAAHVHHAAAAVVTGRAHPALAVRVAASHATTTAAFGLVAATLALRTGSLAAPLAAHVVANAVMPPGPPLRPGTPAWVRAGLRAGCPAAALALLWPATAPGLFGNAVPGSRGANALLEVAAALGGGRRWKQ